MDNENNDSRNPNTIQLRQQLNEETEKETEKKRRNEHGLTRTGRLFGGLLNDFKRKSEHYISDFTNFVSIQCISSFYFIYILYMPTIISYGHIFGQATNNNITVVEVLLSAIIFGIGYALFSGQPLAILGPSGPLLVFETLIYSFCKNNEWDYMSFRCCIGIWVAIIFVMLVAVDACAFVHYISRFTYETFTVLSGIIFIYSAIRNTIFLGYITPITDDSLCTCEYNDSEVNITSLFDQMDCIKNNGTIMENDCPFLKHSQEVTAYWTSIGIFIVTFSLCILLKNLKYIVPIPLKISLNISHLAVLIAIVTGIVIDVVIQAPTVKLMSRNEFAEIYDRTWLISPINNNPSWTMLIAIIPALLCSILMITEHEVTSVFINRKEHKLVKSHGYHLDLLIMAVLTAITSIMGLPWFVATIILSINHVDSLKKESRKESHDKKLKVTGVLEQRVTHIMVFVKLGLTIMFARLMKVIPLACIHGAFLYIGIAALKDIQFAERIITMLLPSRFKPNYIYLKQISPRRLTQFTLIQLGCFSLLWFLKALSMTTILFPLSIFLMIGIRKCLPKVFTHRELKILDNDELNRYTEDKEIETQIPLKSINNPED